jgi:hypothetical protein
MLPLVKIKRTFNPGKKSDLFDGLGDKIEKTFRKSFRFHVGI